MKARQKSITAYAVAAVVVLSLSACSNMSKRDKNTAAGAGIGAVGGAVLTGGSVLGTVGGAAVGGLLVIRLKNNTISKCRLKIL